MTDDLKKLAAGLQAKLGTPTQKPQLTSGTAADAARGYLIQLPKGHSSAQVLLKRIEEARKPK